MRIFTLCLVCLFLILSFSLTASPNLPDRSVPADTLSFFELEHNTESIEPENEHPIDSSITQQRAMMPPTFLVQNDLCGMGIGFIDLTPDPNTQGPWLFMWSNGELTEDIFDLTPGVYTVTIFDIPTATSQQAQIIVGELPFVAPQSITGVVTGNTLCDGTSNGAIDLTVDPLPNDWNYFWSNGETTQDIDNLVPGVYTVSVTWGVTCTTTATYVVPNLTNAPTLSPPIGGFGPDFCEANTGTAGVFAQGGSTPYTYEWSNGATDLALTDLPAGTYTVTVTGADGCTATLSGEVVPQTLPVNVSLSSLVYNTTCNGANGSISITIGPAGFWNNFATFEWSNGETTQNLTGLSSGSYRVTVTRLGTCTGTQVWFVEDTPILPNLTFANTAATCGLSNGAVNLTPLPGGVPPYTYEWSNGETTQDLANVPAGEYIVTLTGGNGCTTTGSATVEDNQAVFGFNGLVTDHNACDTFNGRIILSLFPANLSYQWSNGATSTFLNNLPPGDYTVTVSAGGTCIETETFIVADLTEYPVLPTTAISTTCGLSNGSIDLEVTSGQMPFTYLWSNGMTTQDLFNLTADTFYVTVTSSVGCSTERMVIVPNVNTDITLTPDVLDNISCASPTGAIDLNISPLDSTTNYTILWSNGETSDSLFNLLGGTYMVTVSLGPACIVSDTFTVNELALPPDLALGATPASCSLDNGATNLDVTGAAAPYTYLWSNGAMTEDLSGLPPGNYSVTVTAANSCTAVSSVNVLDNDIPLNISATATGNSSCTANNGSIDITVNPAGSYTYDWSNGANTEDLSNLSPGTYTVNVSLGSCQSSSTYVVADNTATPGLSTTITAAICDADNGAIDLSVSGNTGPYTFLWSNGALTEDLNNILPDNYSVTVTGTDGCTAVANLNVPNNSSTFSLAGTASPLNNCAADNGAIDLNITPAGVYTILWSNGAVTEDISNLGPGVYTVSVTEFGVCTGTASFFVIDERSNPITNQSIVPELCGQADGSIDLIVSGGTAPYNFQWDSGQITEDLNNIGAGTYTVLVTDANDCTATASATVPGNSISFALSGAAVANTSCVADNGSINLSINPPAAYSYLWSEGSASEDLSNIPAGTYTVTVSAGGNCTSTAEFIVANNVPAPQIANNINAAVCGQANGSIDLSVSGSPAPYQYLWSNAELTQDLLGIVSGNYAVTVTAANGCTSEESFVVPETTIIPDIAGSVSASVSCLVNNGAIDLSITPPLATGYSFTWSNGGQTEDIFNLAAGTYTVTVNGGGACTNTAAFAVTSDAPAPVLSELISAAFCGDATGSIDLSVSGASPAPYQFIWSNAEITEDLSAVASGPYSVTVTSFNGCTTVETYTVPETTIVPDIASVLTSATSCVVGNGAIDLTIDPPSATGYTFLWSNGSVTEDLNNLAAGSYTVTVNGGGACTNTAVFAVTSDAPAPILSEVVSAALCGAASGSIDLSVSGASPAPYLFIWSNAEVTEDLSAVVSGPYSVTVTADNGCTAVETYTVPETTIIPDIASVLTSATSCIVSNGAIDLTIDPPSATGYTFLWSNGSVTEDLNSLASGSYTVTVNGGGACTNTAAFAVASDAPSPVLSEVVSAALCGAASGSIDLSVSGASPAPYQFIWSNAEVTEDLSAVVSGSYSVTVTADNGCTAVETYTVPETTIIPDIASILTSATSCVVNNGAIDLSVDPPSATGYTFLWSNGSVSEDLNNVAAGTYTVTVNGGGACTNTAVIALPSDTPAPILSEVVSAALCGAASGNIDLSVSGTSPAPYQFVWSNAAVTEDLNAVVSGPYSVTVTADNGCTTVETYTVPETTIVPDIASVLTAATSCVIGNGAIDLSITPPSATGYTFLWSNGSVTEDLNNVAAGTYTVTVNGGGACTNTAVLTVQSTITAVSLGGSANPVLCFGGNDGAIDLDVSAGTAPFTFNWSAGVSGNPEDPTGLTSGTYTVTVTDDLGCTSTASFLISQPASALQLQCSTTNPVSEPGFTDGTAEVTIMGGTGPYTVNWAPGSTQSPVPAGNFPIQNLAENNYGVTVTDANGCPANCDFTVGVAACATTVGTMGSTLLSLCGTGCLTASYDMTGQVLGASDLVQFVLHQGNGNSIVNEIARSSQPEFCFDPATMTFGTTYYISALAGVGGPSGNVNPNGYCSVSAVGTPIQFNEIPVATAILPDPLNCAVSQVPLEGASNLPGSSFLWGTTTGVIQGSPAQSTVTAAAAGTYTLTVTANGCSNTTTVSVVDLSNNPQALITPQTGTVLDCSVQTITLNGSASGAANPSLSWVNNGNPVGTGNTLAVSTPGQYELVVVDGQTFCSATTSIQVTQNLNPPALNIASPSQLTCAAPSQTLTGSSTVQGIQFAWATINGSDTTILGLGTNLTISNAGTYFLIGLNPANNCSNAISVNVTANQTPPTANAGAPFTLDCAGEIASLNGSGTGAANLMYAWSTQDGNFVSGSNTATPLIDLAGTYSLVVTNPANGCTATDLVVILPEIPVAYASVIQPTCLVEQGVIVVDSVTGLSNPILYSLNNGSPSVQTQFANLAPGAYTLSVQGGNGCSATVSLVVQAPDLVEIFFLDTEAEINLGYSYQIVTQVNIPATEIASVSWTPEVGLSCADCLDPIASPAITTRYSVLVTSTAGCTARSEFVLKVDRDRKIFAPNIFSPNDDGNNDVFTIMGDPVSVRRIRSLQVFSRWGEAVYERRDFSPGESGIGWDGTFKGQRMNPAVFVWQAVVEFADGQEELFTGDVLLKR